MYAYFQDMPQLRRRYNAPSHFNAVRLGMKKYSPPRKVLKLCSPVTRLGEWPGMVMLADVS